ncbi:MAG: hypothetical protein ABIP51_16815 [Bacteroidia bacterium]
MNTDLKKILLEFTNEEVSPSETISNVDDFKDIFEKSVEGDYSTFVSQLKGWANDPKISSFLKSGQQDGVLSEDKFSVSYGSISCSSLIPTQNEIDLNKSLDLALKHAKSMASCLQTTDIILGIPLVTFNGRYIIDGHHRWSQVYCINPNAKMKVINFKKAGLGPKDMLKATQIAIATATGNIHTSTVHGENLLKMNPIDIMKYVFENISEDSIRVINLPKKECAKKIGYNVKLMQKNNQPIPGAPERAVMPQTGGDLDAIIKMLTSGKVQIEQPFVKQTKTESKQMKKINENSAFGLLKNNLAVLALKDSNLNVSPQNLPEISDEDLKSWIEVADQNGKIRNRYTSKKAGTPNDSVGCARALEKLVFDFYKLHIMKTTPPPSDDLAESNSMNLNEFQSTKETRNDDLYNKVVDKLNEAGLTEIDDSKINDFIEYNYDMIAGVIETINPKLLLKNYLGFNEHNLQTTVPAEPVMENINESLKRILKEDDTVDAADPITMFQDFSDISGSFADIYSTLVGYQTSYVQNPKVKMAMSQIMQGVNQLIKQSTAVMQLLGTGFGVNESVKK